ncbi:hypothetical protein CURE108131_23115 [Cupriavidus respiraculi]|uniref:Uncharacterized protein n=1 Tax=Cupriavidus respiraculi TaxID=195930 RepID=A0ABN7YKS4_9BURK|nr:hypothetical protein [Cupriavidus respiraculi]CAG9172432.1 hypothetical protein LMG21510_01972 [Cupriavidus respiraculi]
MTQDESQQVEEALQAWHRWQQRQSFAEMRGMWYPSADSSCREFRSTDLWEETADMGEEADRRLDASIGEIVDRLLTGMSQEHRVAVNLHLMNRDHAVWRSARVAEVHAVYQAAKETMLPPLRLLGVVRMTEAA